MYVLIVDGCIPCLLCSCNEEDIGRVSLGDRFDSLVVVVLGCGLVVVCGLWSIGAVVGPGEVVVCAFLIYVGDAHVMGPTTVPKPIPKPWYHEGTPTRPILVLR